MMYKQHPCQASVDIEEKKDYSVEELAVIDYAAKKAVHEALRILTSIDNSNLNLDNGTARQCVYMSEGEPDMKRIKERIIVNGEQYWISGNSMQELFDKAGELYLKVQTEQEQKPTPLFKEYQAEWMHLYKKDKLRPTTYRTYETLLRKNIIPYFGDKQLSEIKTTDIQLFYNSIDHLARSSIKQMSIILSQIFDSAIEDEYILKNPVKSTRLTYSNKKKTRKALSTAEWKSIIEQLPLLQEDDRTLVALLMYTGMRRGEALALRWRNVDFENKVIHICENITFGNGNRGMIGPPKSEAGYRDVPIVDDLAALLNPKSPNHFVLGGEHHYTESKFDRAWIRISNQIDLHGATPHILRHTYLTIMGGTDTDVKTIQAIAGHADIKTTMDKYVHRQDERIKIAGIKMHAIFTSQET